MKTDWNIGNGASKFTVTGPLGLALMLAYIAVWLLVATAAVETAWAIVFGGLLG